MVTRAIMLVPFAKWEANIVTHCLESFMHIREIQMILHESFVQKPRTILHIYKLFRSWN